MGSLVGAFVIAFDFGRPVLQVRGEDCLRVVDQEEGGKSRGFAQGGFEAPNDRRQFLELFSTRLATLGDPYSKSVGRTASAP
jgi:hypothetical protein